MIKMTLEIFGETTEDIKVGMESILENTSFDKDDEGCFYGVEYECKFEKCTNKTEGYANVFTQK